MARLVLLRHGQSAWNQDNRFTGWEDVDLTRQGIREAQQAGRWLNEAGITFDAAYTSLLKRSIHTLRIVLDALDLLWLPVEKTWRLNERHYGALQGLNKAEMADRYGKEQVFQWRRSFAVQPPQLSVDDPRHPRFNPRYANIPMQDLPAGESLEGTLKRVLPTWHNEILPRLARAERVLVVAHGNSLRALVKYLDGVSDAEIPGVNIPTGIPIVYELDAHSNPTRRYYLGDAETIRKATQAAESAAQVKGRLG